MRRTTPSNRLDAEQAAQLGRLVDVFPAARELGEAFDAAGHELYLVGGTVRDALLAGGEPADGIDLDFATSARPDASEELLRDWTRRRGTVFLTGARFGTVSAVRDGTDVEVTTFRSDSYEPGSRHPEVRYGDTVEADLARRDLTVNAMAVRVPAFEFVDLFGGLADLRARLLRTPVDPVDSFDDDPLRMLRLARFAAQLGADVDPATEAAAVAMAGQLATVSAERIQAELSKLLLADDPVRGLRLLVGTGLAGHTVPELMALADCQDPLHRHKDVWAHTLAVLEQAIALEGGVGDGGPDLVLRLAALLHDIGKPATRRIRGSEVSFHHHEMEGARIAERRLRALRYDKQTVAAVEQLVRMHLRFHTYKLGWTDAAVRRYVTDAGEQYQRLNALTRADVTTGNERRARAIQRRVDELEERVVELEAQERLDRMRPAVDGRVIMQHLGIEPGPLVGEAWEHLRELRIERGPMGEEEALAALDAWWAARSA